MWAGEGTPRVMERFTGRTETDPRRMGRVIKAYKMRPVSSFQVKLLACKRRGGEGTMIERWGGNMESRHRAVLGVSCGEFLLSISRLGSKGH